MTDRHEKMRRMIEEMEQDIGNFLAEKINYVKIAEEEDYPNAVAVVVQAMLLWSGKSIVILEGQGFKTGTALRSFAEKFVVNAKLGDNFIRDVRGVIIKKD